MGDLTAAKKSAEEAISAAPDHESAKDLLASVRQKAEARERQNQLRDGLGEAKRLMLLESIDTAIQLLVNPQNAFPDSPEVRGALKDARADQESRIRARELQSGADEAKTLLKRTKIRRSQGSGFKALAELSGVEGAFDAVQLRLRGTADSRRGGCNAEFCEKRRS